MNDLIADLADREAELLEQLATLEEDVRALHLLAHAALAYLHDVQLERDVLKEQRALDRRLDRARRDEERQSH